MRNNNHKSELILWAPFLKPRKTSEKQRFKYKTSVKIKSLLQMHQLQSTKKSFPLKHNPRSIENLTSLSCLMNKNIVNDRKSKPEKNVSNHTEEKCEVRFYTSQSCNEPISNPSFKYRWRIVRVMPDQR